MEPRTPLVGWSLMVISVIHFLFGVVFFWSRLETIVADGLWNAVDMHRETQLAFWFIVFAVPFFMLGQFVKEAECEGRPMPPWLLWELLAFTALTGFLMPVSGIWLLIFPMGVLFRRRRSA